MMITTLILHLTGAAIGRLLRARWLALRLAPPLFGGTMLVPQAAAAQETVAAELGTVEVIGNYASMAQAPAPDAPGASNAPPSAPSAGVVFDGSVAAVLQQVNAGGTDSGRRQGRASYRGELTGLLPLAGIGESAGSLFGHVRFGQGAGVTTRPTYTGSVNSLAFAAAPEASFAILAQLYYQLDIAPAAGRDAATNRFELAVGKIDPFAFFDQNAVADDESTAFLNNVFVHNPLLDSGGDLGADRYGFTPGIRAAWFNESGSRHR